MVPTHSAHASIVTSTLNDVTILGARYNVTFSQDSSGATPFNDVFGPFGPGLLPFTAANAVAATTDLLTAVNAIDFDVTPGGSNPSFQGFRVVLAYDATTYSTVTGWRNTPGNLFSAVGGPFTGEGRTVNNVLSIATFEVGTGTAPAPAPASVPEPQSLALVMLALGAGLVATKRRPV